MPRSVFLALIEVCGLLLVVGWFVLPPREEITERLPLPENDPANIQIEAETLENPGTLTLGDGLPSRVSGSWPQFRGVDRNGVVQDESLPEKWSETPPRVLWKMEVGEGHAGVAIHRGCAFLIDYDEEKKEDVVRCLSLDGGEEVWRYAYSSKVKRNHGMSRTVPAVNDGGLVTLGPRCQVHCFDPTSGELKWRIDLVREYGTRVPEWYAGQCPLIEDDRVILAPGGRCLMTAIDLETGEPLWETPNDLGWEMTHTSVIAVTIGGIEQYVWNASGGVVGVSAEDGTLLWSYPEWQIKIANIPSPVDLGEGRIFLSGGYNAGAELIEVRKDGSEYRVETVFKTEAKTFGSDQQTPVFLDGLIYGVIPGGMLACLDLNGDRKWLHEEDRFGLGPYLVLNGRILVLDDNEKKPGKLCLFEVDSEGARKVASWKVIDGHDAWAPMAYAGGRLILRDSKTLICLQLYEPQAI